MSGRRTLGRAALVLSCLFVLGACSDPGRPTFSIGEDSPPEAVDPPVGLDAPMPVQNASGEWREYEDFRWVDGVVDGYVMEYIQPCGSAYRADEPTFVWIENPYFRMALPSGSRAEEVPTIGELIEMVVARDEGHEVPSLVEGEIGEPLDVRLADRDNEYMCFSMITFAGSTRDGEGRMPVPFYGLGEIDPTASAFGANVPSCNGNPVATITESASEIRISVTTWIPDGDGRDDCLDGIEIELDNAIGDRVIIDDLGNRLVYDPAR